MRKRKKEPPDPSLPPSALVMGEIDPSNSSNFLFIFPSPSCSSHLLLKLLDLTPVWVWFEFSSSLVFVNSKGSQCFVISASTSHLVKLKVAVKHDVLPAQAMTQPLAVSDEGDTGEEGPIKFGSSVPTDISFRRRTLSVPYGPVLLLCIWILLQRTRITIIVGLSSYMYTVWSTLCILWNWTACDRPTFPLVQGPCIGVSVRLSCSCAHWGMMCSRTIVGALLDLRSWVCYGGSRSMMIILNLRPCYYYFYLFRIYWRGWSCTMDLLNGGIGSVILLPIAWNYDSIPLNWILANYKKNSLLEQHFSVLGPHLWMRDLCLNGYWPSSSMTSDMVIRNLVLFSYIVLNYKTPHVPKMVFQLAKCRFFLNLYASGLGSFFGRIRVRTGGLRRLFMITIPSLGHVFSSMFVFVERFSDIEPRHQLCAPLEGCFAWHMCTDSFIRGSFFSHGVSILHGYNADKVGAMFVPLLSVYYENYGMECSRCKKAPNSR